MLEIRLFFRTTNVNNETMKQLKVKKKKKNHNNMIRKK